ncbi:MAG: hypothetical protein WC196_07235 [Bacilli bacterium]
MKYWTNVVIEGHCLADGDDCPCGRRVPSPFCLTNGNCPHFGWSDSTERNAAFFVPLRSILWDKFKSTCNGAWNSLEWFFWGQLWFNRRKDDEFFERIKVIDDDDPCMQHFREEERKASNKFEKWFPKAKKEWAKR